MCHMQPTTCNLQESSRETRCEMLSMIQIRPNGPMHPPLRASMVHPPVSRGAPLWTRSPPPAASRTVGRERSGHVGACRSRPPRHPSTRSSRRAPLQRRSRSAPPPYVVPVTGSRAAISFHSVASGSHGPTPCAQLIAHAAMQPAPAEPKKPAASSATSSAAPTPTPPGASGSASSDGGAVDFTDSKYDPITSATWKEGEPVPYHFLARAFEQIEGAHLEHATFIRQTCKPASPCRTTASRVRSCMRSCMRASIMP